MIKVYTGAWQSRRDEFNHGILKNKYLNDVSAFVARLETENADDVRIAEFVNYDFYRWMEYRVEIRWLIDTFEQEMSPLSLLSSVPLKYCDAHTREWLGNVINHIWFSKYCIPSKLQECNRAFERVDHNFSIICKTLKSSKQDPAVAYSLLSSFKLFEQSCDNLSNTISRLPREIIFI